MTEKHAVTVTKFAESETRNDNNEDQHEEETMPTTSSIVETLPAQQNAEVSPYYLSKAISTLVDQQIQKSIGKPFSKDHDRRKRGRSGDRRRRRSTRSSSEEEKV